MNEVFHFCFQKGTMASKYISFLMNKMIDEDMEKGDNFTDKPVHVQVPEVGKIYILKLVVYHSHISNVLEIIFHRVLVIA